MLLDPEKLVALIRTEHVHFAEFVPAVVRPVLRHLEVTGQTLAPIMVVVCGVIFVQAARGGQRKSFVSREQLAPVLKVLWPAVAAVFLMHFVGLYVASALYMGFYMRWVGRHSWAMVVLIALGVSIGSFLVFEKWFLVPMPKGPLEEWLGF